jgi:GT2 family glycosyltransferase
MVTNEKNASPSELSSTAAARGGRQAYLVLGMHRSGTSSVSGTLVKLGLSPPTRLMQGRPDNPRGHWESEVLASFHDEILASAGSRWDDWRPFRSGWYDTPVAAEFKARAKVLLRDEFAAAPSFVFKDPRVCRFARFWLDIFAEEGIHAKVVIPIRSPLEVAHSHRTRDGFPLRKGLLLWLRHVLDAEAVSRELQRGMFEWRAFLQDWRAVAGQLETSLGVPWPALTDFSAREVDRFLTNDLKHERVSDAEFAAYPDLHAWVVEAYEALRELARNPASNSARTTLDLLRRQFDDAASLFGGALVEMELAYSEAEAALRMEREVAAGTELGLRQELEAAAVREGHAQAALQVQQENYLGKVQENTQLTDLVEAARSQAEAMQATFRTELAMALDAQHQAYAVEIAAKDAAAKALAAERDTKSDEIVRLEQLVASIPEEVSRAEADVRNELERILESERQARADEVAGYATRLDVIAAERDAKADEIDRINQLIIVKRAEAEEALAHLRREHETAIESERQVRAAELAAHRAAIAAIADERDTKDHEIERLSQLLETALAEAQDAQARMQRDFETLLIQERATRLADAAAHSEAISLISEDRAASLREVDQLLRQIDTMRIEAEASRTAMETLAVARDSMVDAVSKSTEAYAELKRELQDTRAESVLLRDSERAAYRDEIASVSRKAEMLERAVAELRASRSWRITAPVRGISIAGRTVGRALVRGVSAPFHAAVFLKNLARAATPRRVGKAVKSVATGQWQHLSDGVRWFGQGAPPADVPATVETEFDQPASAWALGTVPKVPNDRNYWLPQALRDYLIETFGPSEAMEVSALMDLVSAYGENNGTFETSAEFPILLSWLKALAAYRTPSSDPDVSIIIPVFNKFSLTFVAIAAILRSQSCYSYEIIVADDVSTDGTSANLVAIGGCVRHIRNEKNLRFLLNCNNAAGYARGRFVVFLNNDTLALPGWLDNLVHPLGDRGDVGMSGSKLINGDGTLQEAGGILWNDGSAWNFGRSEDPRLPQFNYLKEADYISGAAIALPMDVWRRLGGFDSHFAPAYYEDTDLAFRVRAAGLKVIYAPSSEIIHHEGMSHGRDSSQGMKAYQVANARKFASRWKKVLRRDHFPNGQHVPLARDRSRNKPHILFVDHYVPEWDRDAGSRVMLDCIKFFVSCGFRVSFWPDNLHRSRPYTDVLQSIGVEVIYGSRFFGCFDDWWLANCAYFQYVFLSRCHISINYIYKISANSNAVILYYGVDIPWKRMLLEYETTGNFDLKSEAEGIKLLEDTVCEKADYIIYLSREECDYAREAFPDAKGVIEMPGWIYDPDQLESGRTAIESISDNSSCRALFVGGFAHGPNGDGVRWFLDQVAPLVRAREPRFVTVIVGSHMPDDIRERASPHIEIIGWASDEELADLLREAACTIAPLRFGAGVKGKVVGALAAGSPVVSTSIGLQGLDTPEEIAFLGDSAADFADAVLECLNNRGLAQEKARKALEFVRLRYSETAMRAAFAPILSEIDDDKLWIAGGNNKALPPNG